MPRLAGDTEDLIHLVDEELVFLVGEVAVDVFVGLSGGSVGGGLGEFLEVGGFAAGAGEGVDEAGEGLGIAAKVLVEVAGIEVAESEEEAGDGELEGALVEPWGVEIFEEAESGFLVVAEGIDPVLFEEPTLVMGAGVPSGDVARGDVFGNIAEFGGDIGERDAIKDKGVEGLASGPGEASDFAVCAVRWSCGLGCGLVWHRCSRCRLVGRGIGCGVVGRGGLGWGRKDLEMGEGVRGRGASVIDICAGSGSPAYRG